MKRPADLLFEKRKMISDITTKLKLPRNALVYLTIMSLVQGSPVSHAQVSDKSNGIQLNLSATDNGMNSTTASEHSTTARVATTVVHWPFTEMEPGSGARPTVSKQTLEDISGAIKEFTLIFEVVSVTLTATSAFIYSRPSMRCPTAVYLVALNSADSAGGLVLSVYRLWQNADSGAAVSAFYHYFSIFGALFLSVACRRMVYCFMMLLTVERFFVIAFPLKARYMQIVRRPKLVIAALVLVVQAYHVYFPLKFVVRTSPRHEGYTLTMSDMYKEHSQVFDYLAVYDKVLFSYVPLAMCLALSMALVVALRRHGLSRRSLQEKQSDGQTERADTVERQLAVTIWVSSLLFVLLSLPSNTVEIVAVYHPHFRYLGFEHNLYQLVHLFAALTLVATRFTNFLAYLCLSTAFRHRFIRLLCWKRRGRDVMGTSAPVTAGRSRTMAVKMGMTVGARP